MKELAKQMSEAISTERERRFIMDEATLETVLRENGWCKQSEVVKTLSDIKRQIHEKAIYPHNSGIEPYISLKVVDAIIEAEMRKHKGGEDHV